MGTAHLRTVAIFRNNLFKPSEPFIVDQAAHLRRFSACYFGRLRVGEPPTDTRSFTLRDRGGRLCTPMIAWQLVTRDPRPYLRLVERMHPVLIHAHFGVDAVYALPIARRLRVPLVTTFHGFDATLATAAFLCNPAWANYPLLRNRLARRGALFLCASSFIRQRLLARGFPGARTRVHYIGVDTRAVQPRAPAEERPIVLHVARQVAVKGTRFLVRAFAMTSRRAPGARLVIIGDGPQRQRMVALARSLGLGERVQFLGAQPHREVLAWMRKAAVLVAPSVHTLTGRTEGLGMVLLEAAATGIPVIATCQGGMPEVVKDGVTGLLVPERNVNQLCDAIVDLLDSDVRRFQMGARARKLVEQHFDIRRQTATLEDCYEQVIERNASDQRFKQ